MGQTRELFPEQPKVKQRRVRTHAPKDLNPGDKRKFRAWALQHYPQYCHKRKGGMKEIIQGCFAWHCAREIKRKDWCLTCMKWVIKHHSIEMEKLAEKPQQAMAGRGEKLSGLADVIELVIGDR